MLRNVSQSMSDREVGRSGALTISDLPGRAGATRPARYARLDLERCRQARGSRDRSLKTLSQCFYRLPLGRFLGLTWRPKWGLRVGHSYRIG